MNHIFNVEIAIRCGVHAAILLHHIYFWVCKNTADNRNEHDGRFWTYNSVQTMCGSFPYLTKNQIDYALKRLKNEGYIEIGNYNKHKYDRTTWYTVTEKAKSILENSEMENGKLENVKNKIAGPIPDYITNNQSIYKTQIDYNIFRVEADEETPYHYMIDGIPTEQEIVKWAIEETSKMIQKYCGRPANSHDVEKFFRSIVKYIRNYDDSAYGGIDSSKFELLKYAFEVAANSGQANWNYINGILQKWDEYDLSNLQDVIQHEEERTSLKKQRKMMQHFER
ncbi:MAG: DnaD domain protein [Peptococcaceae bacterium]|nr:DnaD domain protein [Peptococcaceae bacterium]